MARNQNKRGSLSPLERLTLPFKLLLMLVITPFMWIYIVVVYYRSFSAKARKRALTIASAQNSGLFTARQMQALLPSTSEAVRIYCSAHRLGLSSVPLATAYGVSNQIAKLHFIDCDPQDTGKVLMYSHGGGYVAPLQANSMLGMALKCAKSNGMKLALLEYGLAPDTQYPGQLAQAAAGLTYLLGGHHPSDIYLGGDSMGGNLTLGLLAHLLQPHPSIPVVRMPAGTKLTAAFGISPRTINTTSADSFTRNRRKDVTNAKATGMFIAAWKPTMGDVWASPQSAEPEFWADLPVKRVLLLAGADECYVDDVREFARKFGAKGDMKQERVLVVTNGEHHGQCVLDYGNGIVDSGMMRSLGAWLAAVSSDPG